MSNYVIEVHKSPDTNKLYYIVGTVRPKSVDWHGVHKYQNGHAPSVSQNGNDEIISVYTDSYLELELYCIVGKRDDHEVIWGEENNFASGNSASVALSNSLVVVAAYKSSLAAQVYYRVGSADISNKTVSWYDDFYLTSGMNPSVAMDNDGTVVIFYEGTLLWAMYYQVGIVNGSQIEWGDEHQFQHSGIAPNITINQNNIAVAQWSSTSDELKYCVGKVDPGTKTISFEKDHKIASIKGANSINFITDTQLIEVDQSDFDVDLHYSVGDMNADCTKINWNYRNHYTNGAAPDIS